MAEKIRNLALAGPFAVVTSCCDDLTIDETKRLVHLGDGHVYCCFGAHPKRALDWDVAMRDLFIAAAISVGPALVAWGECGLDFSGFEPIDNYAWAISVQEAVLEDNLKIAAELGLPLQFHVRDAESHFLAVLDDACGAGCGRSFGTSSSAGPTEGKRRLSGEKILSADWKMHWHSASLTPSALRYVLAKYPNCYFGVGGYVCFPDTDRWEVLNALDPGDDPITFATLDQSAELRTPARIRFSDGVDASQPPWIASEQAWELQQYEQRVAQAAGRDMVESAAAAAEVAPSTATLAAYFGSESDTGGDDNDQEASDSVQGETSGRKNPAAIDISIAEMVKAMPLDRMVLETDGPYFCVDTAGPADILAIAKEVAFIKDISIEEVIGATTRNARDLYGIVPKQPDKPVSKRSREAKFEALSPSVERQAATLRHLPDDAALSPSEAETLRHL